MNLLRDRLYVFFCLMQVCLASLQPFDLTSPIPLDAELNYDFKGSTVMNRKWVKLTSDAPNQYGYIVSNAQRNLPTNFVCEMEFKVSGKARLFGDGLALWFLEEDPSFGTMFGLNEYYKGVSLALDTYRNGKAGRIFPRLVLMHNDGTKSYDKDNDGVANELDSCALRAVYNNEKQEFSSIRVSYSALEEIFNVEVNYRGRWEKCIAAKLNIGPVAKIAVSAATGDLSADHIVRQIKVTDFGQYVPEIIQTEAKEDIRRPRRNKESSTESSGFFGFIAAAFRFILKLVAIVALVAAAYLGYKWYKKYRQEKDDIRYKLA